MGAVDEFLGSQKVPLELRNRVREFFTLNYPSGHLYHSSIMDELPSHLKADIVKFTHRHLFKLVPLLNRAPDVVSSKFASSLKSEIFFEGDQVWDHHLT